MTSKRKAAEPLEREEPVRAVPEECAAAQPAEPAELPEVLDLAAFLSDPDAAGDACSRLAACFKTTGLVVVRDPRVAPAASAAFLDLLEAYFEQPRAAKLEDARPDLNFQVGVKPEGVETPLCVVDPDCQALIADLAPSERPCPPTAADPKWRFHWRIGPRPESTAFPQLNVAPVVPAAFEADWARVLDTWGASMLRTASTVAEMLALGLGLSRDAITRHMRCGPHLLAPTGVDLAVHGAEGTLVAGFHTDLNLLSLHGRCRFPGLSAWTRSGRKVAVKVPEGCILVQAGNQMEWLTGGAVLAGHHEVSVTSATVQALQAARRNHTSAWRVSSTMFAHCASDSTLQPLDGLADLPPDAHARYPPTKAGHQVQAVLKKINMAVSSLKKESSLASEDV